MIERIVNSDLCIGCGACTGICPQELLTIDLNIYGEYTPSLKHPCSKECGLCLSVCPFNDENLNENEIGKELFEHIEGIIHSEETGYYLESFVGYSPKYRKTSASGGMATWFLTTLLENNVVDYVICVAPQENPERLYSFQVFDDAESLIRSSGSAYYPVELSHMIRIILDKPGRYAITGLPCFVKAIRLASFKNKKLKERIIFTIGLVCGQIKNKHYTTYLSELANVGGNLQSVIYRGKSPDKPANNYYFQCVNQENTEGKVFWNDGVSEAWTNRWFTPNACNYCDDVFAELADVVFMDAWLPEYSRDSRGTSIVIVRLVEIMQLIQNAIDNKEVNVRSISVEKVIQSQKGVIDLKRKMLKYRLYIANKKGISVPKKRVEPAKSLNIVEKQETIIKLKMQDESKNKFKKYYQNTTLDLKCFTMDMHPFVKRIKQLQSIKKCLFLIYGIISVVQKKVMK